MAKFHSHAVKPIRVLMCQSVISWLEWVFRSKLIARATFVLTAFENVTVKSIN